MSDSGITFWVGTVPIPGSREGRTVGIRHSSRATFVREVVDRFAAFLSQTDKIEDFPLSGVKGLSVYEYAEPQAPHGYREVFERDGVKMVVTVPQRDVTVERRGRDYIFAGKIIFEAFNGDGENSHLPEGFEGVEVS